MTSLELITHYGLDKNLGEFLSKHHADSADDVKVEVADYVRDRRVFFTVGQLREARAEQIKKYQVFEQYDDTDLKLMNDLGEETLEKIRYDVRRDGTINIDGVEYNQPDIWRAFAIYSAIKNNPTVPTDEDGRDYKWLAELSSLRLTNNIEIDLPSVETLMKHNIKISCINYEYYESKSNRIYCLDSRSKQYDNKEAVDWSEWFTICRCFKNDFGQYVVSGVLRSYFDDK